MYFLCCLIFILNAGVFFNHSINKSKNLSPQKWFFAIVYLKEKKLILKKMDVSSFLLIIVYLNNYVREPCVIIFGSYATAYLIMII